jgi:hypothetical protein
MQFFVLRTGANLGITDGRRRPTANGAKFQRLQTVDDDRQ